MNTSISVAPMMDWTDRHCRYFLRLLNAEAVLYTEMIPSMAVTHGDKGRFLNFNPEEEPLIIQFGGSDRKELAAAAKHAAAWGYRAINLNCGCPSERVQAASFGACLMNEPHLVADVCSAMAESGLPVGVKTRIGVDEQDSEQFLHDFVGVVAEQGGVNHFVIHARKAWLHGLSPKENRTVPPLNYDRVYRLKKKFPQLTIEINGGFTTIDEVLKAAPYVDGVMIGRAAYHNPWLLTEMVTEDRKGKQRTREEVANLMLEYIMRQKEKGVPPKVVTRHMLGLYHAVPHGKSWRQHLTFQHDLGIAAFYQQRQQKIEQHI